MQMKDYPFSVKFLSVVRDIIRKELDKKYSVRIATVNEWNRTELWARVHFVESPNVIIKVNMGAVQPRIVGQKVRVERVDTDWFLTHVITQGAFFATT